MLEGDSRSSGEGDFSAVDEGFCSDFPEGDFSFPDKADLAVAGGADSVERGSIFVDEAANSDVCFLLILIISLSKELHPQDFLKIALR